MNAIARKIRTIPPHPHHCTLRYLDLERLQDLVEKSSSGQRLSDEWHFVIFEGLVVQQVIAYLHRQSARLLDQKHLMYVR